MSSDDGAILAMLIVGTIIAGIIFLVVLPAGKQTHAERQRWQAKCREAEAEQQRKTEEERQQKIEDLKAAFAKRAMDLGLNCPECKTLALPIPGTADRYRCQCGTQFVASKHDLPYFEDAVKQAGI